MFSQLVESGHHRDCNTVFTVLHRPILRRNTDEHRIKKIWCSRSGYNQCIASTFVRLETYDSSISSTLAQTCSSISITVGIFPENIRRSYREVRYDVWYVMSRP